nr:MAG TPA: hypothetical protein [Caudoviricetes sp.]
MAACKFPCRIMQMGQAHKRQQIRLSGEKGSPVGGDGGLRLGAELYTGPGGRTFRRLCRRNSAGLRPRRRAVRHAVRPRLSLPNSPRLPGLPAPDPLVPGCSAEKKKAWGTVDKPT